uniref:YEATS domain-containing protein n=1 Tax=Stomoxys calcitrans TaxID=35570 RepID=A0A1I8QC17_STOCA
MFSGQSSSPRKRKHSEYHDPDYPKDQPPPYVDESPIAVKSGDSKRPKVQSALEGNNDAQNNEYLHKVQEIIEKEFNTELVFKQKQLLEIDERLAKARHMLDKLRYTLVSSYYKKQDLPLAAVTTSAVRGVQTLFTREDKGPQMQIHPSLKKLIGKKPKDLSDVIRSCPKRTAAQNAVQTIRAKSEVQKREERKLKQIIKGQGIVIDHSIDEDPRTDIAALINAAQVHKTPKAVTQPHTNIAKSTTTNQPHGKPLNASRLNNKIKHLIVVGNTSKFIGTEQERDPRNKAQILTHKWLVYVQAKDTAVPIEKYVRKVRFNLHHSYRPNDVVDVQEPPFQVARRGWGEFPIRVQLYFHSEYNQKPVQLLHTVVLDKSHTGIQTLGAETLLEVWLRNVEIPHEVVTNKIDTPKTEVVKVSETAKNTQVSTSEELVDDNLLEFLNKIEASQNSISADIEKIQPTFVIPEPLENKSPQKLPSPSKLVPKSPTKTLTEINKKHIVSSTNSEVLNTNFDKLESITRNQCSLKVTAIQTATTATQIKIINTVNRPFVVPKILPLNATFVVSNARPVVGHNTVTLGKTSITFNKGGKLVMPSNPVASAVKRTILPVTKCVTNTTNTYTTPVASPTCVATIGNALPIVKNNEPKQILQKKLVQLVDSTGKVKYMQMLVAASSVATSTLNDTLSVSSMAPKLSTVGSTSMRPSSVINTSQSAKGGATPIQRVANGANNKSTINPGGITMKPNIFKIVPENMQTKPRVVTFSTITAVSPTTTVTTTSALPASKPQTVTKPDASKILPKSNGSAARNIVFHKEGKVYIIDPLQMKLKQQQKKQVSLLKPQVSLLKQQKQQQQQTLEQLYQEKSIIKQVDHDYLLSPNSFYSNNAPQIHLGLKQQRLISLNSLQLMQMKRVLFEKGVLKQQFTSMQSAVEFVLRRLQLIAPKDSVSSAYPFITHSYAEFQSLTAFKQRSYEWLRAKNTSRILRSHKDLQNLNKTTRESFWSTKEIANFARQYGYTPDIKSLPKFVEKQDGVTNDFKQLLKGELKQKEIVPCDTLTDVQDIRKWANTVWPILTNYHHVENENLIIDVDNMSEEESTCQKAKNHSKSQYTLMKSLPGGKSNQIYLPTPPYLENECNLVSHICKDLSIALVPEELGANVWHPSTQTILAHTLNLFLQKVIRKSVALKYQENGGANESLGIIQQADIAKALSQSSEFDFLTNKYFGISSKVESSASTVKDEAS